MYLANFGLHVTEREGWGERAVVASGWNEQRVDKITI